MGYIKAKANICIFSAVLGIPFMALCTLCQTNFWFSASMLALEYLFAESWMSPAMTMILNTISPDKKGFSMASFLFFSTIGGIISTSILGALDSQYIEGKPGESYLHGYFLCLFVFISYGGSILFKWLAGKSY